MAVGMIALHLTDRCQLDCQHCLRDPGKKPKDLPLELIERILDEARRVYRSRHVAFTGGEPTLHPELPRVLDAVVDRGMTFHIVTNGRTFERFVEVLAARPERRAGLSMIDFSLDGADAEVHDAIRGDGSFREVMAGALFCNAHQLPFLFQMTVNAKNAHQIESLGLLATQLGASRLSFSMMQATGTLHDDALFLGSRALRGVLDRILRLADALKMPVSTPEGFPTDEPFHVCASFRGEQLHVDVEGRLGLCCQHAQIPATDGRQDDIVGSLQDLSLSEAHKGLLGIVHGAQVGKLSAIERGDFDGDWDEFPCNWCMKHFGKPHWTSQGSAGPRAARARWNGAWSETNQRLRGRRALPVIG